MSLKPWEQTWNGRTWRDMPPYCGSEDEKKMNFFFWRRGMLDVEDEVQCEALAQDGIVEMAVGEKKRPLPRLVSRLKKRFGSLGRSAKKTYEPPLIARGPRVPDAEELQWRAKLRLRLCEARKDHVAAIPAIAKAAGVGYSQMSKFLRTGMGFPFTATLKKVEVALEAFKAGEVVPPVAKRGQVKGWRPPVPEGCIPYKEWLGVEAQKRGVAVHSLRVYLMRNEQEQPPLVKVNKRSFFVRVTHPTRQEVAA